MRQTCLQASSVQSEKNSDVGKHGMLCEHRREERRFTEACRERAIRQAVKPKPDDEQELSCCTEVSVKGEERMFRSERLTCISLGTETSQDS